MSSIRVLDQCHRILDAFPDARFTLFVPTGYWRTVKGAPDTTTPSPLLLSDHPGFCDALRALDRDRFEVGFHGHHHGIPGTSNNDEMQRLNYEDALEVIDLMRMEVTKAGLIDVFRPILRPPAWRMSPDAIRAARDNGFRTLTLSPDGYAQVTYQGADKGFGRVVYNTWPLHAPDVPPIPFQERMCLTYHACEWDKTFLSVARADELMEFLGHHPGIEFTHVEGLLDG